MIIVDQCAVDVFFEFVFNCYALFSIDKMYNMCLLNCLCACVLIMCPYLLAARIYLVHIHVVKEQLSLTLGLKVS